MKLSFPTALLAFASLASAQSDIPTTAISAGGFETLVAALGAADLVGALSDPNGPFTVFAPTDDAFAALPEGLVECLLKPENSPVLTDILLYHVVNGTVLSSDLTDGMAAPTLLNGTDVMVDLTDGVKINQASVTTPDIEATNGVIHVIDSVLVPPDVDAIAFLESEACTTDATTEEPGLVDIPQTAVNAGMFDTLVAAVTAAGLADALSEPNGPYTVFAPNDDAFDALPAGLVDCLVMPENSEILSDILMYHVVNGTVMSTDLTDGMVAPTLLDGADVTVDLSDGVKINGSTVTTPDVMASNGVIHILDSVLVPAGVDIEAFLASCFVEPTPTEEPGLMDIPETAIKAGVFETLVAALTAADLVEALSEPNGDFTVFAPTDDAFAALPDGLVECLIKPERANKEVLTNVLLYHVVEGVVMSSDLTDGMTAPTLLTDAEVVVDLTDGVKINDSTVSTPDVMAINGVIHIIDSVLVPPGVDVVAFLESEACAMDSSTGEPAPEDPEDPEDTDDSSGPSSRSVGGMFVCALAAFLL